MTKFCVECGQELIESAKFCSQCGTKQPLLASGSSSIESQENIADNHFDLNIEKQPISYEFNLDNLTFGEWEESKLPEKHIKFLKYTGGQFWGVFSKSYEDTCNIVYRSSDLKNWSYIFDLGNNESNGFKIDSPNKNIIDIAHYNDTVVFLYRLDDKSLGVDYSEDLKNFKSINLNKQESNNLENISIRSMFYDKTGIYIPGIIYHNEKLFGFFPRYDAIVFCTNDVNVGFSQKRYKGSNFTFFSMFFDIKNNSYFALASNLNKQNVVDLVRASDDFNWHKVILDTPLTSKSYLLNFKGSLIGVTPDSKFFLFNIKDKEIKRIHSNKSVDFYRFLSNPDIIIGKNTSDNKNFNYFISDNFLDLKEIEVPSDISSKYDSIDFSCGSNLFAAYHLCGMGKCAKLYYRSMRW